MTAATAGGRAAPGECSVGSANPTISSALAERAAQNPEAAFLLSRDGPMTYGEAAAQAEALAAALSNLGVEAGDRIALVLPAWPEFAVTVFAASRLGASVVPLNPRLTLPDLRYRLRHSGAVCAVSAEDAYGIDYLQMFEDLLVDLPELRNLVTVGDEDLWYDDRIFQWEDLLSAGRGREVAARPANADEPFALLYTSGTTGKPKGVELSQTNLLHAAGETAEAVELGSGDVVVGVSALFHAFGLGPGLLGTLLRSAGLVLLDDLDARAALDAARRHRATVHYGVPSLFAMEMREIEGGSGRAPGALRACLASGGPMSDGLARRVEKCFGAPVLAAYTLTEAASTVAAGRVADPSGKRRFTVGRPVGETSVRVTDDDGALLPPESVGEIRVRGPGVMCGYYRQPAATTAAFDGEGYLRTGDLGMLDEDGYLHLVGRRVDTIARGGFDVHPREVEDRLAAHPAVERAVVVGVPDDALGEAVCACVVRVEGGVVTEEELREWVALALAKYKLPDLIRFMDDLPLTSTGKVWRMELVRRASRAREDMNEEDTKQDGTTK